jgi:cation diffusion facilitator family transporter
MGAHEGVGEEISSQHGHAHHEGEHAHGHEDAAHSHGHDDQHSHAQGPLGWLKELLPFGHGHSHGEVSVDDALESSERGIWALKVSLVGLGITALFQLFVVVISGSVALLADTIHNASDALTAVPLWIAFSLAKRPPTRRYTYGYGRAEDVAGVVVVVMILVSALVAAYESIIKLANPEAPSNLIWVGVAAVSGFIGNEAVAQFRIRVGKEIGSAALVADGQHARVDGFTSLAVLLGVIGVWLGYPLADPIIGLLITLAILFILKDAALTMWHRLMDAVDPEFVETVEHTADEVEGVHEVHGVRVRWLGHRLHAEMHILVDEDLPTSQSHRIAEEVRHRLLHNLPRLESASIHVDPCGHSGTDPHHLTAHHTTRKVRTGTGNATS